jgi:hypothetical protein
MTEVVLNCMPGHFMFEDKPDSEPDWEGENPITVRWRLASPLPEHLRRLFQAEPGPA